MEDIIINRRRLLKEAAALGLAMAYPLSLSEEADEAELAQKPPPLSVHEKSATDAAMGKKGAYKEPCCLIFWQPVETVAKLMHTLGTKGDGKARLLGFGLPCATFELDGHIPTIIHKTFALAEQYDLAVMLQFDFHVDWQNRPDLWNWFDPKKPGFKEANRMNVEWFGWDGPPARARYLNWGAPQRMAPPICFTSKKIRAEWARLIERVIAPQLTKELAFLERAGKRDLFAGVLVGSEPTFDNYAHTDPETAKMVAADGAPAGQLGYRALLDMGFNKNNPPLDIHQALGAVIQETVAFWCKKFADARIPVDKLYTHIPAGAPIETTSAPAWTAFNKWSRPGWSTYPVGQLEQNFDLLYSELKKRGNPAWGGVEANVGVPGSLVDWETYLAWHYNHGAKVVAINIGATGTELPAHLEKSAFSKDALAAYRLFLSGGKLTEKAFSQDLPQMRLRRKMETLQAGFRRWQLAGRDWTPIARFVEERLPQLMKAGRLHEAEAVLDEALKRVNEKDQ